MLLYGPLLSDQLGVTIPSQGGATNSRMSLHRLPLKLRSHPIGSLLLTPWVVGWLATSLRLHSPLGHGESFLAVAIAIVLLAIALLIFRRAFSGRSPE